MQDSPKENLTPEEAFQKGFDKGFNDTTSDTIYKVETDQMNSSADVREVIDTWPGHVKLALKNRFATLDNAASKTYDKIQNIKEEGGAAVLTSTPGSCILLTTSETMNTKDEMLKATSWDGIGAKLRSLLPGSDEGHGYFTGAHEAAHCHGAGEVEADIIALHKAVVAGHEDSVRSVMFARDIGGANEVNMVDQIKFEHGIDFPVGHDTTQHFNVEEEIEKAKNTEAYKSNQANNLTSDTQDSIITASSHKALDMLRNAAQQTGATELAQKLLQSDTQNQSNLEQETTTTLSTSGFSLG